MKKIIAFFSLLIMSETLSAQGLQAGVRSGVGVNYHHYDIQNRKDYAWVNQLSLRHETKKKWAFELGLEHNYTAFRHTPSDNYKVYFESSFAPPAYEELSRRVQMNRIAVNMVAQYDITCPALQNKCSMFKRFKNYMGIQISPSRIFFTEDSKLLHTSDNKTISESRYRYSIYDLYFGINNTMKYSITPKLHVIANISVLMGTGMFDSKSYYKSLPMVYRANTLVNKTIGINYRLSRN